MRACLLFYRPVYEVQLFANMLTVLLVEVIVRQAGFLNGVGSIPASLEVVFFASFLFNFTLQIKGIWARFTHEIIWVGFQG